MQGLKRVWPATKIPVVPDSDGCYPYCPYGVKVDPELEGMGCENPAGSCRRKCTCCTQWCVTRIESPTCQACVYYIQNLDDQVICTHPIPRNANDDDPTVDVPFPKLATYLAKQ